MVDQTEVVECPCCHYPTHIRSAKPLAYKRYLLTGGEHIAGFICLRCIDNKTHGYSFRTQRLVVFNTVEERDLWLIKQKL